MMEVKTSRFEASCRESFHNGDYWQSPASQMDENNARKWFGSDRPGPHLYMRSGDVSFDTPWFCPSYPRRPPDYQYCHPGGQPGYPNNPYKYYLGYGTGDWFHSAMYSDPTVQPQNYSSSQEFNTYSQVNQNLVEPSSSTRPVVRRQFVHKTDVYANPRLQARVPSHDLGSPARDLPRGVLQRKRSAHLPPLDLSMKPVVESKQHSAQRKRKRSKSTTPGTQLEPKCQELNIQPVHTPPTLTQFSPMSLSVKPVVESKQRPAPRKRQRPKSTSPATEPQPKRQEFNIHPVPTPPSPTRSDSQTQHGQCTLPASLSSVTLPSISRTNLDLEYLDDGACDILGEGGYGYVQRGRLEQDEQMTNIAAKFFKPNRASVEEIVTEARIQRYLQDTGAVPMVHGLINMASKGSDPILVQECVGQGTTVDDLMARGADIKTWLQFTRQAAKGLQKIHRKGVLLNDIKFDNILLDESDGCLKVKFVDMGMATFNSSYTSTVDPADMVCCQHIAPEVVNHAPSSVKSDLYSLGYLLRTVGANAHLADVGMLGSLLMCDNPTDRLSLPVFIKCVELFMDSCN